ncbi:MAG: chemotaxis protein methyltransferase CheR, partial [bacterium]
NDETWKVKPSLKKQVTFRRLNLMRETFPFKKPFHIIFCRNVMIYFDRPTIQRLVNHFYEWLVPGGYLFVGHSESLGRIDSPFTLVKPAVYQKL